MEPDLLTGHSAANQTNNEFSFLDSPKYQQQYLVSNAPKTMRFFVEGVRCSRCLFKIENLVTEIPGLSSCRLDMGKNVVTVESASPETTAFSQVAEALTANGYKPHPVPAKQSPLQHSEKENRKLLIQLAVAGACAGNIMLLSVSLYGGAAGITGRTFEWLSLLLFLPVLFYSTVPFYKTVLHATKNLKPSIDLPIVFAVLVGFVLSTYHLAIGHGDIYFDSLSVLVFLLLSARYLLRRIQQNYLSPSYLQPFFSSDRIRLFDEATNSYKEAQFTDLEKGQRILVKTGEKIPADGTLLSQAAVANTAILTGESYPKKHSSGEILYAGFELLSGEAELEIQAVAEHSRVGQWLHKMESEILKKTPLISLTDRMAQWFTAIVLIIGLGFFAYYLTVDSTEAVRRSLALVILACPCALAFATPLTQSLSLIKAAKASFLIKNADSLERLAQVTEVLFDKTGTLSKGQFQFLSWVGTIPNDEAMQIMLALEKSSEHPVAIALRLQLLKDLGGDAKAVEITDSHEELGRGVKGRLHGSTYEIRAVEGTPQAPQGYSHLYLNHIGLYKDGELLFHAILGDEPRPDAKTAIQRLQTQEIHSFIISGDRHTAVDGMAKHLGLNAKNIVSSATPETKHQWVKAHDRALMVGDGANDSLALASAYVSAAVQGSMETSLQAADIYLAQPGALPVYSIIRLAKETMKVIHRNLAISLIYNTIGGIAALMGYINPLVAAVLMPISSVIVVSSSLWGTSYLRKFNSPQSPVGATQ